MTGSSHSHLQETALTGSRQDITRRVALVGMSINIFLTIAQVIGGILTHSQALIADAMHTLSDLAGDIVVLFASHHAGKDADEKHPYGHGRIETLATVVLGLLLGAVAVIIFLRAWDRLTGHTPLVVPAKRINSPMLKASAWHHRSDAISSVLVLLAIGGAQLGFPWLDAVAAILVAIMIFYMAIQLILESTSELVDTGLETTEVQEIRDFINGVNGVENVHLLRTRRMGGHVLADVHIQVDGRISVSEGHYIGESAMYKLRRKFPTISDVVIHIDPEDDENTAPSRDLPSRSRLLAQLHDLPGTTTLWPAIRQTTLHYINGKINLELIVEDSATQEMLADFANACNTLPSIERVQFLREIAL